MFQAALERLKESFYTKHQLLLYHFQMIGSLGTPSSSSGYLVVFAQLLTRKWSGALSLPSCFHSPHNDLFLFRSCQFLWPTCSSQDCAKLTFTLWELPKTCCGTDASLPGIQQGVITCFLDSHADSNSYYAWYLGDVGKYKDESASFPDLKKLTLCYVGRKQDVLNAIELQCPIE